MALMMMVDGWHYEDMEGYGASELNLFFVLFSIRSCTCT